ncbi:MAG: disulfide bond formation protein B [Patescibacteria group bacterium]|nr:disulfide bond formation protein B [Patescibacteria group bacterium]
MPNLETFNHLIGISVLLTQVIALALFGLYFLRNEKNFMAFSAFMGRWGLWLAFFVSLFATIMSLAYSDYFGLVPCSLCWFQRMLLFPQVILFLMAAAKKDIYIADYSIVLSVIGAAISLYQHYIQMTGESPLPCPVSGGDCVKRFLFEFNYITIPLAAFSAFALLFVLMLYVRARPRASRSFS